MNIYYELYPLFRKYPIPIVFGCIEADVLFGTKKKNVCIKNVKRNWKGKVKRLTKNLWYFCKVTWNTL